MYIPILVKVIEEVEPEAAMERAISQSNYILLKAISSSTSPYLMGETIGH